MQRSHAARALGRSWVVPLLRVRKIVHLGGKVREALGSRLERTARHVHGRPIVRHAAPGDRRGIAITAYPAAIRTASPRRGAGGTRALRPSPGSPAPWRSWSPRTRWCEWVYGAFVLVLAAFLLIGSSLGDRYGRRRVSVLGAAIFAAASVWCALSPGPGQLIAARAVQGAGGALLVPASLAIVGASFEGSQRAKAIGAWGALSGTAMAVGPVLGGWLVADVSWRAAFLLVPAMALVAIPITLSHVPESRDPEAHKLDLIGAAVAA